LFLWGVAIRPFTGPGENQGYWALVPIAAMVVTAAVWNVALIFSQRERDLIVGYAIYALVYIPAFAYAALMAGLMILRAPL
jgi:hypothetical protein